MQSDFMKEGLIDYGSYGYIYHVKEKQTEKDLVIKRNLVDCESNFSDSLRELDCLSQLHQHPFIIGLDSLSYGEDFFEEDLTEEFLRDDVFHFVLEKAEKNLLQVIEEKEWSQIKIHLVQLLLAVEYCHQANIIHRDIKPANLLIVDGTLKLADFGLSKRFTYQGYQTPDAITAWYRAPEVILSTQYNFTADIWSIGCVIYEMLTKKPLMENVTESPLHLIHAVNNIFPKAGNLTWQEMLRENSTSSKEETEAVIELLTSIFCPYQERATAGQLLEKDYFNDYRSLIQETREKYPGIGLTQFKRRIIQDPTLLEERKKSFKLIKKIYQVRLTYPWYRDRILFHAIELFDRVLFLMVEKPESTQLLWDNRSFLIHICLYLNIKYFLTLQIKPSFNEIFDINQLELLDQLEFFLLDSVIDYQLYRMTSYEVADVVGDYLNPSEVERLLQFEMEVDLDQLYPSDIYQRYREKKDNMSAL